MSVEALTRAIDKITDNFYRSENKAEYESYIGVEEVISEFAKINLPRDSDILSPSSGPGIFSAKLHTKGYSYIDALVEDPEDLKGISSSKLYRNVIVRPLAGLNSTGLRGSVYDAVVMLGCGGFGKHPATVLDELLRITRPDGHVLWTFGCSERIPGADTDYGLFNQNLIDFEKDGRIVIKKLQETFKDEHSGLTGYMYVLKKLEVKSFEPKGVPKVSALPSLVNATIQEIEEYADQLPDNFTGHLKLCQAFFKLRLQRNVEILDVSAHVSSPGLVGRELQLNGYENVDGLDHDLEVLDASRQDALYRNYIVGRVAELGSIPVRDNSYEVILIADGFAPDKILPAAFDELLRVLRPGGYIMWTMADGLAQECPDQFAHFDLRIVDLAEQRRWELLVGPVYFEKFRANCPGRFYMMRKCYREVFARGSPHDSPATSPMLYRRRGSLKNQF